MADGMAFSSIQPIYPDKDPTTVSMVDWPALGGIARNVSLYTDLEHVVCPLLVSPLYADHGTCFGPSFV